MTAACAAVAAPRQLSPCGADSACAAAAARCTRDSSTFTKLRHSRLSFVKAAGKPLWLLTALNEVTASATKLTALPAGQRGEAG